MEVVPYFLSIIVTVVALYWSAAQFRRKPGTPLTGLFRYREAEQSYLARRTNMADPKGSASRASASATRSKPR